MEKKHTMVNLKAKRSSANNLALTSNDQLHEIYQPKGSQPSQGAFMTEVNLGPSISKKSALQLSMQRSFQKMILQQQQQTMYSTQPQTTKFNKNLMFPSLAKSASLFNLRSSSQNKKKRPVDYNYLTTLSKAKNSENKKVDLKNEKGEFATEVNQRQEEAQGFISNVYKRYDPATINDYVTSIEGLHIVKDKIEIFKGQLTDKVKIYNSVAKEVKDHLDLLAQKQDTLKVAEANLIMVEPDCEKLARLFKEAEDKGRQVDFEDLTTDSLNHVIDRLKRKSRDMQQPIQEKKDNIEKLVSSIASVRALQSRIKKHQALMKLNKAEEDEQRDGIRKIVLNTKEAFLQDISQKTMFDEVYKNQIQIIQEKDKEEKQKKQEEVKLKEDEKQSIRLAEERKRTQALKKTAQYEKKLLRLQEACNLKEIVDLEYYNDDLKDCTQSLQLQLEENEKVREEKKDRLEILRTQLAKLKTRPEDGQKHGEDDEARGQNDPNRGPTSRIEKDELIHRKKRIKELIANAMVSIARVAHQLKEDFKITPVNADQKLSVCGLRLEHMVATLYKKKPTFNIESVNTDYSSDLPPYFLGIKNAIFVSPDINKSQEMNELERLYQDQIQGTGNKVDDEEYDFVNDAHSDIKKVLQARAQAYRSTLVPSSNGEKGKKAKFAEAQKEVIISPSRKDLKRLKSQVDKDGGMVKSYSAQVIRPDTQASQGGGEKLQQLPLLAQKKGMAAAATVAVIGQKKLTPEQLEAQREIQKRLQKIAHRTKHIINASNK